MQAIHLPAATEKTDSLKQLILSGSDDKDSPGYRSVQKEQQGFKPSFQQK